MNWFSSDTASAEAKTVSLGVAIKSSCVACPDSSERAKVFSLSAWFKSKDWLFILSFLGCLVAYLSHWGFHGMLEGSTIGSFVHDIYSILNTMLWGLTLGILAFGLVGALPRELVMAALGSRGSFNGILRAATAGLLFDVCSHGVLLIGLRFYERGASAAQMVAFLVASPWNSLSLTIILISLVGWPLTLVFFFGSFLIAIITGLLIDLVETAGFIPANPYSYSDSQFSLKQELRRYLAKISKIRWGPLMLLKFIRDSLLGSRMIIRWLLLGVVISAAVRTFLTPEQFTAWLGPSLLGLSITLLAATIIEVCSEGSVPLAADLANRAGAPGNAFAFMMAGVATDATEIMGIKEVTKNWRISLLLPLISLPQVILLSWLLNFYGDFF